MKRKQNNSDVMLNDILERLRKLDERLDKIETEIEGVKKAVKMVMFIFKLICSIATIGITAFNFLGKWLPKGKRGRVQRKSRSKK